MRLFSAEWIQAGLTIMKESFPTRPGLNWTVQYLVTGGPSGDAAFWLKAVEGRCVDGASGRNGDADFTLTFTFGLFSSMLRSYSEGPTMTEQDWIDSLANGGLAVSGDLGKALTFQPMRDDLARALVRVASSTDLAAGPEIRFVEI